MESPLTVGIDVGGTFTDLIAQGSNGETRITKVPSTPESPEAGVLNAISDFLASESAEMGEVDSLMHGSTVSTNAIIEQSGAETGLLITAGYSAVPVVGTQSRRESDPIAPFYTENDDRFLLPSDRIREIPERIDADGEVLEALDEGAVRDAVREFRGRGIDSIAVCYLFSFLNADHEERTRTIIEEEHEGCHVSLSSEVIPKIREFPRLSTTAIDAYTGPVLGSYLQELREALTDRGLTTGQVYFMLSQGGLVPFETAKSTPCRTLLSGPAAGVRGAQHIGRLVGASNVVTMDMGGTSCDISLIHDGELMETQEDDLGGHLVSLPAIEISAIGAGGGTQARVETNRLKVGPKSSGANPGPICYGQGGDIPTITDANVLLGRLNPDRLLGGEIDVAFDRTRRLVEERIASELSMDVREAASAILRIINDKMKKEINLRLSQYGLDAREFTLLAFGGAGPTHAAAIARRMDIPRVIVPPWPGINSAAGLLSTDIRQEYVKSRLAELSTVPADEITERFAELEDEAIGDRTAEGFSRESIGLEHRLDLRYAGQGYELTIEANLDPLDKPAIRDRFDALHESRFGHSSDGEVEIVSYRVSSVVERPRLDPAEAAPEVETPPDPRDHRDVVGPEGQPLRTPIYDRSALPVGHEMAGPVVIEQLDTTTVVEPAQTVEVDEFGNLQIMVNA